MSDKLYNTGLDKVYSQQDLGKLFNIDKRDFLKSPDIPVIKRQFNYLPGLKGDPPRALTDDKPTPIVYYQNVGVVSDFHKGLFASPTNKLWEDGTYDDMKKKVMKDNEELYKDVKFAKDTDFDMRFNRLEQEQSIQSNMANYFLEKQQEKELANRIILEQYGLNPQQVETALAEKKISDAMNGLTNGKRQYIPNGARFEETLKKAVSMRKRDSPEDMDLLETPKFIKETTNALMTPRKKLQMKLNKEIGDFNITKTLAPLKDDINPEIDYEPSARYNLKKLGKQSQEDGFIIRGIMTTEKTPFEMILGPKSQPSPQPPTGKKRGPKLGSQKTQEQAQRDIQRGTQSTIPQMKGAGTF